VRGGLTRRMIIASGLLALVVATGFAVLLASITQLRGAEAKARHSQEVLASANRLDRLVSDLQTGQHEFLITAREDALEPWSAAQTAFPRRAKALERLVADNPAQEARAQRIEQTVTSYIQDYSIPLVNAARRDPATARTPQVNEEGQQRIEAIQAEFDRFEQVEANLGLARQRTSEAATQRAILAAGAGLTGSVLIIGLFAGYLTRAIVRPVRRASVMAARLAGGDLGTRIPEHGVGEVGALEASFNTMASSLEHSNQELAASRARIVAEGDRARRRIERDLHDGTQQRLVSLVLDLRAAEAVLPPELQDVRTQLAGVATGLAGALDDLQEISRGIHPAILSEGGLGPALKALARRSAIPAELDVDVPPRLDAPIEVATYYVVSEALANAAKHARASVVHVRVRTDDDGLHLSVRDDGVGGATAGGGSGLIGLTDRVEALGGTISVTSPTGQGTALLVDLPIDVR
jgi:signal transduction histidine kinase